MLKIVGALLAAMTLASACNRQPATTQDGRSPSPVSPAAESPSPPIFSRKTVLVFTRTLGFRHDSIEPGKTALKELASEIGLNTEFTEDPGRFEHEGLIDVGVVVFLNTTGDVLGDEGQFSMESYMKSGGGFIGIHSATDTEYDWPWYGRMVGAYFKNHPAIQQATVRVVDDAHPSTAGLPASWQRNDEWYNFRDVSGNIHVLAELDESSYQGGEHGSGHPIAWCQEFEGGRSWYTGGGHTNESFSEPMFRSHLKGALQWAAGSGTGGC